MASGRSTNMLVAQYCLLMFTGKPFCPFLTMLDLAVVLFCLFFLQKSPKQLWQK